MIVANDVGEGGGVFGGDRNTVHLLTVEGTDTWPTLDKAEVALRLIDYCAARLQETRA